MQTEAPAITEQKPKITIGSKVKHKLYGIGKVLSRWPNWWGCPRCFAETYAPRRYKGKEMPVFCSTCKKSVPVFLVKPEGVFDVLFGDQIQPLYRENMEVM